MPNIALPTIKFGKRKERSQIYEVLTDDGRWIDKEFPVLHGCGDDDAGAFLIDYQNQFRAEDITWHQLVSENSYIPISLREKSIYKDGNNDVEDLKKLGEQISEQSFEQAKLEQFQKSNQSVAWNRITWIVSIVIGGLVIIAAITRWGG